MSSAAAAAAAATATVRVPRTCAFYTHKGGVGKTTALVTMAIKATDLNLNCLVIDVDAQMNTTHFLLNYRNGHLGEFDRLYNSLVNYHEVETTNPEERTEAQNQTIALYRDKSKNLYDLMRFSDDAMGYRHIIDGYMNGPGIGYRVNTRAGRCDLIASHPMINEYEILLAGDADIPGRPFSRRMFEMCVVMHAQNSYDLILIDFSPSSSLLNQIMVVQCDYFVMPCSADEFAYYAIRTMTLWITSWIRRYYPGSSGPQLVTVLYNKYKVGSHSVIYGRQYWLTGAHKGYIDRLTGVGGALAGITNWANHNTDLCLIRDGLSAIAKRQSVGKVVYDELRNTGPEKDHSSDRFTILKMRHEYDVVWNRIAAVYNLPRVPLSNNTLSTSDRVDSL